MHADDFVVQFRFFVMVRRTPGSTRTDTLCPYTTRSRSTANDAQLAAAAEHVGQRAAEAVDRALVAGSAEAIATLERAAENASTVGREAALQLRDQLAKVNELAVNIEIGRAS